MDIRELLFRALSSSQLIETNLASYTTNFILFKITLCMDVPVKTWLFGLAKWFWPSIFSQDAEAGKRYSKDQLLLLIGQNMV
jgi:hypothetical protein